VPIPFEDDLIEAYLRALKESIRLQVEVSESQERAFRARLLAGSLEKLNDLRFPNSAPEFAERIKSGITSFNQMAEVERATARLAEAELDQARLRVDLLRLQILGRLTGIPQIGIEGSVLEFRPLIENALLEVEVEAQLAAGRRGEARVDVEAADAVERPEVSLAAREHLAGRAADVAGLIARADRAARLVDEFVAQTRVIEQAGERFDEEARQTASRRIFGIAVELTAIRDEAARARERGTQPLGIARRETNLNAIRGRIIIDGIEVADLVIRGLRGLEPLDRFPARLREALSRAALIRRSVQVHRAAPRAP